ncbi:MAG: glutamate mutase L [Chloroflexota bacterium]
MIKETTQETEQPEIKPVSTCLLLEISERTTTALLIKNVIGYSRLVSRAHVPSTHKAPENNAINGVFAAIRKLEKLSNQTLFNSEGDLILHTRQPGRGVDKFLISISVGGLLKTIVVAPTLDDPALESAVHLLQRFPSKLEKVVTGNSNLDPIENTAWMVENKPDFIFVVGSDSNNRTVRNQITRAAKTVGLGVRQFSETSQPDVLYAASGHWVDEVEAALNLGQPLKTSPNLRPDARHEHVKPARRLIEDLVSKKLLAGIPGLPELIRWFGEMPFSRNEGLAIFGRYQAALANGPVLILDLDSNGLTMVFAKPKFTDLIVRPDLGIGANLSQVESLVDIDQLAEWLPYQGIDESKNILRTHLINRSLYPETVPQNHAEFKLDLVMLQGLIRQGVLDASAAWGLEKDQPLSLKRLFVRGDLLDLAGNHEHLVEVLFNALQLHGECELFTDSHNAMALLGQLLEIEPTVAVDVIESDALQNLGWLVGVSGRGRRGKEAMMLTLNSANAGRSSDEAVTYQIMWGDTKFAQWSNNKGAQDAFIRSKRRLGFATTTKLENIEGLAARVWVDARGRPVTLPDDNNTRWEQCSNKK